MDIIEKIEAYCLTLRRLPDKESTSTTARENEYNSPNAYDAIFSKERTREEYEEEAKRGLHRNHRFVPYKDDPNRGVIVCRMIKIEKEKESGWLVKIDRSHGSIQRWNRKGGDFFGKTAEEAVDKAVSYIEEQNARAKKIRKRIGVEWFGTIFVVYKVNNKQTKYETRNA